MPSDWCPTLLKIYKSPHTFMLSLLPLCQCPFHHNSKMLICWLFYLEIECGMWKSGSIHIWYLLQSGIWTVKMVHFIKGRSRVVSIVQVLDLHVRQHKFYSIVEFVQRLCYQRNNNHCVHNLQQCAILHNASGFFKVQTWALSCSWAQMIIK